MLFIRIFELPISALPRVLIHIHLHAHFQEITKILVWFLLIEALAQSLSREDASMGIGFPPSIIYFSSNNIAWTKSGELTVAEKHFALKKLIVLA